MTDARAQQRREIEVIVHVASAHDGLPAVSAFVEVGAIVRHPERPDWGLGQVQSVVGARVTVNFEHAGKVVLDLDATALAVEAPDWL